jgi:HlyD family secretion protein
MSNNSGFGWRKWIVLALIAGVVVTVGILFFAGEHSEPPQYQTATVTRGDLTQAVTATGTLNPVTNVTVGSQISGIIQKLYADWNSPVKAGQVVAQLDPATYQAAVAQAQGDLANSKANLELVQVEARRAEELFKNKLISESDHDTAIANLHQAEAMVQIKQASLDNARINLERCTIYSPVDGTVISRNVDVGQTVAASLSAPTLFIIANDLAQMQIDANVSEADIGNVEEGQQVSFTVDAFPDRTFAGKVVQIRNSPTTVQNVVTYDAVIGVSNADLKLRPGMTANASIISAQRIGVLKVPNAALRFRPPEPSTNRPFVARWLAKIGLGESDARAAGTNAASLERAGDTNKPGAAAEAPLTGNEPPQELMRRVREMRERGEEPPPEVRARLRALFQSGALQRPGEGGGRPVGAGALSPQPSSRTVYVIPTNAPAAGAGPASVAQGVRVKIGITDGAYTEIQDGLKAGESVVTGIRLTRASAPSGSSPFGGGRRF